jgi:triosephosphate isomerase
MRKMIIAGNWKMNKNIDQGVELVNSLCKFVNSEKSLIPEVIVCPPFTHLVPVIQALKGCSISVGSQNCSSEESGAFTGEVSAEMIASTGTEYTIIGHSERRTIFNEGDKFLEKKVKIALKNGLKVIFCCGEILEERESNIHFEVVKRQLNEGLFSIDAIDIKSVIIAYEPVWAIGTGKTATSSQAQEMHSFIRGLVKERYGLNVSDNLSILYGGSCNPKNASELFSMNDVDGGLIGGASLKPEDFCSIIKSF